MPNTIMRNNNWCIIQNNHAVVYKKESDSRESTESQLCNPMYLTPAWLPLESWEYPYTSWCAVRKLLAVSEQFIDAC